jgi:hypothetical protein
LAHRKIERIAAAREPERQLVEREERPDQELLFLRFGSPSLAPIDEPA